MVSSSSHVHSRVSSQSTRAWLCFGAWSYVLKVATLPNVEGDAEEELEDGWDRIN
ncbi:hypothetical protein M405DRAFT_827957 [Rhizopogon salebrosus TDB-379]|nr:hypothetical protein M405DRAFT_827957 [Rhizopogon salebrosus TDB-379]